MVIKNTTTDGEAGKNLYANYKFSGSALNSSNGNDNIPREFGDIYGYQQTYTFNDVYSIPLKSVRGEVIAAEELINETKKNVEQDLLRKLFVNPYIDPDLNEAHDRVWKEVSSILNLSDKSDDSSEITKATIPNYICFDEYDFAERHKSLACRRLISEFDEVISQSTFSYFFQIRKILAYMASEIVNIKSSLLFDFGENYETQSQQKIALRYDTWAKVAIHYTRRITKTIVSKPGEIPHAEVDKISKKQAAQLQAFFAIRLNAIDEEINNILENLKRDLVDNSEVFFNRYLSNSIKMVSKIVEPLDLEYNTTNFKKEFPSLSNEVAFATLAFEGNFTAIHADLVERFEMSTANIDAVLMLIHEKRKFAHYITQLSSKATVKKKVIKTITDDKYSTIFRSTPVNSTRSNNFKSSHSNLDDLDKDSHPQYLLKNNGTITGNIAVDYGVTIDGVSLSGHSHTGNDGSSKILSTDIDYSSARNNTGVRYDYAPKPLSIGIEGFVSDIIDGGIPVFDAIVYIETDDVSLNNYDYEIIYTEIV
jgi:hypothetical protein